MKPQFDHEKLDVYGVELEFIRWVTPLLKEIDGAEVSEVRDHLDRASLSMLLNTAEGNGKRPGRSRYKFFDDARGSATECAACLDALVAKGAVLENRINEGKDLLLRVVQMLSKLIDVFGKGFRVHEERGNYEDEDENQGV
jgi:four helix bundle protein